MADDLKFKGPDGAYYSTERDASMAYEYKRWANHGRSQFCIWLVGGTQIFLIAERMEVAPDGSLIVWTKFKEEPEFLSGSYAPGTWRSFWVMSAMDGTRSHIVDDTSWWANGKGKPETNGNRERERMTPRRRLRILTRDNYTCKMCGRSPSVHGVALHVDHVLAIANGGKTDDTNLQTLCMDCNLGKGVELVALGRPDQSA